MAVLDGLRAAPRSLRRVACGAGAAGERLRSSCRNAQLAFDLLRVLADRVRSAEQAV
jgi:hypothetical protein